MNCRRRLFGENSISVEVEPVWKILWKEVSRARWTLTLERVFGWKIVPFLLLSVYLSFFHCFFLFFAGPQSVLHLSSIQRDGVVHWRVRSFTGSCLRLFSSLSFVFSVTIFYFIVDRYVYYAAAIVVISTVSLALTVHETRAQQKALRDRVHDVEVGPSRNLWHFFPSIGFETSKFGAFRYLWSFFSGERNH